MSRPPNKPKQQQQKEAAPGWQSRLAAAELLHHTLESNTDLETALDKSRAFNRLEGSDRGFARAIAGAGLRGVGRIDYALAGMIDRPIEQIEPEVRAFLRAGAAQLWILGVAGHAAVSATVEAARNWREASRGGGLINAVLRRASREAEAFRSAPATSVWPDWLAAKLKAALGVERADAMAELQLDEPPTDLTLKPSENPQIWAERLGGRALSNGPVRLQGAGPVEDLAGYADGVWWVQDAAATVAARVLGDVRGKLVADLCAAPGGKALQLAAAGARVSAVEISRARLERLRENAARTGLAMEMVEADARVWRPAEKLDAVLLDAPCSALGVLRRHPEGAWRRNPRDLARFPAIQRALVDAAGEMLKPGGWLVYCVCTPAPEEGREVVDAAIAGQGWRRVKIKPDEVCGFIHALTDEGDVITAPQPRDANAAMVSKNDAEPIKSDVFYVARLERVAP